MIESYTGLPGSGKTLHAVKKLLSEHKAGRPTYANFHARYNAWQYIGWEDLRYIENGLIVLDEAHMLFSSRNWSKTTSQQLGYWQQHRKLGVDLIWIAQSSNRVDTAVRELTAFESVHRRMGQYVIWRKLDPLEPYGRQKAYGRGMFRISPELTKHYWTEERIGDLSGLGAGFGRAGATEYGPPPNLFRVVMSEARIIWVSAKDFDPVRLGAFESIQGFYSDVHGRLTEVGPELQGAEALTLIESARNLIDTFFGQD